MLHVIFASHLLTFVTAVEVCKDGTSVGNDNFKKDKDFVDDMSGLMFLVKSSMYQYGCCGLVRQFKSYSMVDGDIYYLIWRPTQQEGKYRLVGSINSALTESPRPNSILPSNNMQPEVMEGDLLGWYSPALSSVPYISSEPDGDSLIMSSDSIPDVGDVVDWTTAEVFRNRTYAVSSIVNSVTEAPEFKNVVETVEIDLTRDVGSMVYKISTNERQYDDTVIALDDNSQLFKLNEENQIVVAGQLAIGSYSLDITATNICGMSSSVTVSVIVTELLTNLVTDPITDSKTDGSSDVTEPPDIKSTLYSDGAAIVSTTDSATANANGTLWADISDDDDDDWKYGVGFSVTIVLLATIVAGAYCLWKWKKNNQVTKPKQELEKGAKVSENKENEAKDGDAGDDRKNESVVLENQV